MGTYDMSQRSGTTSTSPNYRTYDQTGTANGSSHIQDTRSFVTRNQSTIPEISNK